MNRIKIRPLAEMGHVIDPANTKTDSSVLPSTQKTRSSPAPPTSTGQLLDYSLFIPQHYECQYAYPLIVWLHSRGGNHRQIYQVMPQLSSRNFAAVAIKTPSGDGWDCGAQALAQTLEKLEVAIDHAKLRLNINPQRIFVAGLEDGGSQALQVAFTRPDLFAGVASLNGALPNSSAPLSNWQRCRDLPLFLAQARDSKQFSESQLCQQLRLLHTSGFSLTLRQYPGSDPIHSQVYPDLNTWIMETIGDSSGQNTIVQ